MIVRIFISFFLFSTILYSSSLVGGPTTNKDHTGEKFQPGDMIMHHILDTHDWHILDWKGHPVSIPLPIIIFHEGKGLQAFLSSRFEHGHKDHNGYRLDHGNIIAINNDGSENITETQKIWERQVSRRDFLKGLTIASAGLTRIKK